MLIGMLLVLVLVVLGIVWFVRSFAGDRPAPQGTAGGATPLEILDRRLAEGSISLEDYEQRRRVLSGRGPGAAGDS